MAGACTSNCRSAEDCWENGYECRKPAPETVTITKDEYAQLKALEYEHKTHCSLLHPATMGTKDDHCDCHEHDFVYEGHGHNDDAYKCTICGLIEWR